MVSGDKGIVMFHGPPGTGKTNYIRRLLPIFTKNKKRVIIIPKNILEEVESPTFSTFMVSNFNNSKAVFIIEDAESIIAKRDESGSRSQVISTLLNISDGILNDLYKIQVILTFNTDLQNIDEALLRKGRLIAKHEFGHLSKETAKELCDNLGVSVPSCELTLANIYAQKHSPDDEILLTGTPKKKKENLGF
jgi:ATP-dependent 26S proteasome regulatory subunit